MAGPCLAIFGSCCRKWLPMDRLVGLSNKRLVGNKKSPQHPWLFFLRVDNGENDLLLETIQRATPLLEVCRTQCHRLASIRCQFEALAHPSLQKKKRESFRRHSRRSFAPNRTQREQPAGRGRIFLLFPMPFSESVAACLFWYSLGLSPVARLRFGAVVEPSVGRRKSRRFHHDFCCRLTAVDFHRHARAFKSPSDGWKTCHRGKHHHHHRQKFL